MVSKSRNFRKFVAFGVIFSMIVSSAFVLGGVNSDASSIPSASGRVTASGGAFVRQSASEKSSKVRIAANGASVSIAYEKFVSNSSNSSSNIWYYTNLGGFIRSDLVASSYGSVTGYTTDYLNARSGAGTGFGIQRTLAKGAAVDVVLNSYDSNGNLWYKIKTGNYYTYVSSKYISLSSGSSDSSSGSDTSNNTNTVSYSASGTTKAALNARTGAGTNYRVVTTLNSGSKLTITGKTVVSGVTWYKLSNGYYVCGTYVTVVGSSESSDSGSSITTYNAVGTTTTVLNIRSGAGTNHSVKTTYAKGQKLTIVGKTTVGSVTWYKLSNGYFACGTYVSISSSGSDSSQNSDSVTPYSASGTAKTALNARTGAGTNYRVATTLNSGSNLTITGKITVSGVIWYKLSNGYYVCGTYVTIKDNSSNTTEYTVTDYSASGTTTAALNARSGPSTKYDVKTTYNRGTSVTIIGTATVSGVAWYKLSNGYFVCASYVGIGSDSDNSNDNQSNTAAMTDAEFSQYLTNQGFPASYVSRLVALHQAHPNWDFKADVTGLDWNTALNKMYGANCNLIYSTYKLGYRDVGKDSYNFLTKSYIPKDGSTWFKASDVGVAYFMDPRNWLDDSSILMFEDHKYSSGYQTEDIVKSVLTYNATLKNASANFMSAASIYNINPVYLASKSYSELGTSDFMINGHTFSYGGSTYSGCYNAFNIGATDTSTGSAAINGLIYANGGASGTATSYGRKWNSLEKAILGGAQFLSADYISKNQYTGYLEHFNVMNGLSSVGTHVYMTAVYAPMSMASVQYQNYGRYGILNNSIVFKIPVYSNMPAEPAPRASEGSNNNYIESLNYTAGASTGNLIVCDSANINTVYQTTFAVTVPNEVASITLSGTPSDSGATISGLGDKVLNTGANTFTLTCQAPSGKVRTYTVTVTRSN